MDLKGRVALVTGASMGLGRRFALDLAAGGAIVVGVARGVERLAEVEQELRAVSAESWIRSVDVSADDAVRALVSDVIARHGRLDIVISNAGMEARRPAAELTFDEVRDHMRVNYFGMVAATVAALPHMMQRREGWIVGLSSGVGRAPIPFDAAYAASKAAVLAFLESISYEAENAGVRVKVLFPGFVGTTRMASDAVAAGMPVPPRSVRKTEEHVSRLLLRSLDRPGFEINAARMETFAPVARALAPGFYRRSIRKIGGLR